MPVPTLQALCLTALCEHVSSSSAKIREITHADHYSFGAFSQIPETILFRFLEHATDHGHFGDGVLSAVLCPQLTSLTLSSDMTRQVSV